VQEARSVNQIGHKNIIDIFAFGDLPNNAGHYFVMERLEGESLASRIQREKRILGPAAIAILEQVADAIDAAHRTGIWHRDLKPDNVFLVPDRGGPHVKVLDFGIAKLTEGAVAAATRTGVPMGTPMFMSPEQWKGREVDHRTDVYALAVMAYAMLTGSHPFEADSFPTLMYMHLQEPPPKPSTRGAPAWADAPILAGLAKEKADRPTSAGDFVALLRKAMESSAGSLEGPLPAVPVEPAKPAAAVEPCHARSRRRPVHEAPRHPVPVPEPV
jgi:serine/threonine-protein kinase